MEQGSTSPAQVDRRFAEANGREKSSWQVTTLWDIHHNVVRRLAVGQKNVYIAKALNITKEQVSSIRNSPIVQEQLKEIHAKAEAEVISVKNEVKKLAPKAMKVLEEILDSDSAPATVKLSAAKDVLDRGGHAAPAQVNHLHGVFTTEDLMDIKERARRLGAKATGGPIIEADAEVIELEKSDFSEEEISSMVQFLPKGDMEASNG